MRRFSEPESRGLAHVGALEGWTLTFVINCNLQLGPVRGNGKIIQGWSRSSAVPAGTSSR